MRSIPRPHGKVDSESHARGGPRARGPGGGFPYDEPNATFRINQAFSGAADAFPVGANIFVPRITVETYRAEINNGRDEQCAGQPGYGEIDEISGSMGFNTPGNKTLLSWPPQGGALSFQVARADSGTFLQGCTIFNVSTLNLTDATEPVASRAFFYLVRSSSPNIGSWGTASTGDESEVSCAP